MRPLLFIPLACLLALTGCSTYAVSRYAVSVDTVTTLRTMRGQSTNVGAFSSRLPTAAGAGPSKTNSRDPSESPPAPAANEEASSIECRAVGPIKTPDGETFSQYVRAALISELKMAEVYSATAPVTLVGTLDHVDFSSVSGEWQIELTVSSSNGRSVHVAEKYGFDSSWFGETACNQTAQAFMPGVQDLIAKLVHDPGFKALLAPPDASAPALPVLSQSSIRGSMRFVARRN